MLRMVSADLNEKEMKFMYQTISVFLVFILNLRTSWGQYKPNWDSLDSRPIPKWYDDVKIGIFMTWGVYSVPSCGNEWFWWNMEKVNTSAAHDFMKKNYPPGFTFGDFASEFHAEFYDPDQWAELIQASGAKYTVLTTKHHSGFTLWPSKVSFNWNSMDVGPKRDLVGDLAAAIAKYPDIHFGLYHSLFEWFNPLYLQDKATRFQTNHFVTNKAMPEMYELVNAYKPQVIFSDGEWEAPDWYWNSTLFLAWLYNESPVKDTVVVNDRWGSNTVCKHGDYFTCSDKYNPGVLVKHKWEDAMTLDKSSWGFRRNAALKDYLTIEELLEVMASTISCGGNLLVNVGPTADGRIVPILEERLRQMGAWLKVNGEAIYSTVPWTHQNDTLTPRVWYTSSKSINPKAVYAILLDWPRGDGLSLGAPVTTDQTVVSLLGYQGHSFTFTSGGPGGGININIPVISFNNMPCQWAWVLKFTNLAN